MSRSRRTPDTTALEEWFSELEELPRASGELHLGGECAAHGCDDVRWNEHTYCFEHLYGAYPVPGLAVN